MRPFTALVLFLFIVGCDSNKNKGSITGLSDSTIVHFSYTLVGSDYYKETSMYDPNKPILEQRGSFTSPGANEVLVSVPFLSPAGAFTKIFLARKAENNFQLLEWLNKRLHEIFHNRY